DGHRPERLAVARHREAHAGADRELGWQPSEAHAHSHAYSDAYSDADAHADAHADAAADDHADADAPAQEQADSDAAPHDPPGPAPHAPVTPPASPARALGRGRLAGTVQLPRTRTSWPAERPAGTAQRRSRCARIRAWHVAAASSVPARGP